MQNWTSNQLPLVQFLFLELFEGQYVEAAVLIQPAVLHMRKWFANTWR